MPCAKKTLVILMVAIVGIWGCAQSASPGASSDRLKALELKNAKLEDDYRNAAAVRDQLRRQLAALEAEQRRLTDHFEAQFQELGQERNLLRQQLSQRTLERDALFTQFEQFHKGLKDLLVQTEAALARPTDPATTHVSLTDERNDD